jgi:hypothetical protein
LQELLAPLPVESHSSDWSYIGAKRDMSLDLSACIDIDVQYLLNTDLSYASVARKMSWASRRNCTRIEDRPYSLMGLFGISIPMLCGEGDNVFISLQEEIIKTAFDMSIFAWQSTRNKDLKTYCGLLAERPDWFEGCSNVVLNKQADGSHPYSITNLGLSLVASSSLVNPNEKRI